MIGLVLEVSTERGIIAVFDQKRAIFQEQLPFGFQCSHALLPELENKLKNNAFKLSDLSYIAVGVGPGSYTGIRVGASIAKSLAFVLNIPLIGVCTLDTFIPDEDGLFAAIIDAKIGGAYLQSGRLKNGQIDQISAPKACSLKEAGELLKEVPTLITPHAEQIQSKLKNMHPECHWHWQEKYPSAERLMKVAEEKMKEGAFSMDCKLELLYMRKTQAEIERENHPFPS